MAYHAEKEQWIDLERQEVALELTHLLSLKILT